MKPLMLKGHERAITELTYNHDGDLLFTCSKDNKPCLWWAESGERIGTYRGHNGAVWSLSVSRNSKRLLTGSADNSAKIWDVQSGRELFHINSNTPIRAVKYGYGDHLFFTISDSVMGFEPKINIHRHAEDIRQQEDKPLSTIAIEGRVQTAVWGMLNQDIAYASSENVIMHDVETGKVVAKVEGHRKLVKQMVWADDFSCFATASMDCTAKLWDPRTMQPVKTYETDKPVNAVALAPNSDMVIIGGGQEADIVTTSHGKTGQFQVRFYHKVFEEEVGTYKGHFGPVHTLQFAPDGSGFASGAEDGYVRVHHFDDQYNQAIKEENLLSDLLDY